MSKKTEGAGAAGAAHLSQTDRDALHAHLSALRLPFALANYSSFAQTAADKQWSHMQFLQELIRSEAAARADRRVERLVAQAPACRFQSRFTSLGLLGKRVAITY